MDKKPLELEQAIDLLLRHTPSPAPAFEAVGLLDALGRVCARDIRAAVAQPPFDRSPLDGYALRSADLKEASADKPALLQVSMRIYAGDHPREELLPGQAARIMTGAPIPAGADCVVAQEIVRDQNGQLQVFKPLSKYANYVFAGEDIPKDQLILEAGQVLDYAALGVLAGQGLTEVEVYPKPSIGIFSTGSELALPEEPLPPGKIYDSNCTMLAARIIMGGGRPVMLQQVADDPAKLTAAAAGLLEQYPLVITTGGVSVGEKDYMPLVAAQMGAEVLFHGLALKPGSPALACRCGNSLLLSLSGNPFAAAATFELLGMPLLRKLGGHRQILPRRVEAFLAGDFQKTSPNRRLLRARLEGNRVFPPQGQASGTLGSFIGCNCLIDIPAGSPILERGTPVDVIIMIE